MNMIAVQMTLRTGRQIMIQLLQVYLCAGNGYGATTGSEIKEATAKSPNRAMILPLDPTDAFGENGKRISRGARKKAVRRARLF